MYKHYDLIDCTFSDGSQGYTLIETRADSKIGGLGFDHLSVGQEIVRELNKLSEKIDLLLKENDKLKTQREVFVERCLELEQELKDMSV